MEKKCVVLFSGGLDSRLVIKIMQEQGFKVFPVFFRLPFGCGCCNALGCSFSFSQTESVKLEIFDCTKGKLFKEYMEILKKAENGRGSGVNPCKDCKIFIYKKAKEFADEKGIDLLVSGEVLGERPMSQMKNAMNLIDDKSGLKGRLLKPLSAKLLSETDAEKSGLVDREKLYSMQGRQRKDQMELADKFKIKYPSPGGGCLLCEKFMKKRFMFVFERGLDEKELIFVNIGRHFVIDKCWIIIGRNKIENDIIETKKTGEIIKAEDLEIIGPNAIMMDKCEEKTKDKVKELMKAYSKEGSQKEKEKFEEFKL